MEWNEYVAVVAEACVVVLALTCCSGYDSDIAVKNQLRRQSYTSDSNRYEATAIVLLRKVQYQSER